MSDLTAEERDRLAALRAQADQIEAEFPGVKLGFEFRDHQQIIDEIAERDAAVFVKGEGFGFYQPAAHLPELPAVEIAGLEWLEAAVRDGRVTCGYFGIGNQIEAVQTPWFAHLRLAVDEKDTPLYVWLDGATEAWKDAALNRFVVCFPPGPDGFRAYMATGPMKRFDQPTVVSPKIGRNDPCPCGSGQKFKRCHGG